MKKMLALALAAVVAVSGIATVPVDAYEDNSLGKNKIGRVGSAKKSVNAGKEFELEVRTGRNIDDDDLRWSIGNTKIVKFDDDDRSDDEIELKAVKAGTTKVTCKNKKTGGKIVYTVTVKKPSYKMSRVGKATRTVKVGSEFELKVKKHGSLKDSHLWWSIGNTKIVKFDDDDRSDDDIELKAVKAGTTKITCKNKKTGGKIVYTIKVVKKANHNGDSDYGDSDYGDSGYGDSGYDD